MKCKCWNIFTGLCLKNLLVYYRLKQFIGSVAVLISTILFLALRLAIQPQIDSKDNYYAFNILPSEYDVILTYAAHICYPFYEKLISKAKTDYREAINELYGYLKNNKGFISHEFKKFLDLSTEKICFSLQGGFDHTGSFPPNLIKESVEEVLKQNFDARRLPRCDNYKSVSNGTFFNNQKVQGIHFLASRAIPISFGNSNQHLRQKLERFPVVEFIDDFYQVEYLDKNEREVKDSTNYEYCIDSSKIRFQEVPSKSKLMDILNSRREVSFGIEIDQDIARPNEIKMKFITRFENYNAPIDWSLGFISETGFSQDAALWSGQLYIQSLLNKALTDQNNNTLNMKNHDLLFSKFPYKDAGSISIRNMEQILFNIPYLVFIILAVVDIMVINAISSEREREIDKYFAQIGIGSIQYACTWAQFWLIHNACIYLILICQLKWSSILQYTPYSILICYSFTFTAAHTFLTLLLTSCTRKFSTNFIIYSILMSATLLPSFMAPTYKKKFTKLLNLFPPVNISHFIRYLSQYEIRTIGIKLEDLRHEKLFDYSTYMSDYYIYNMISASIFAAIYIIMHLMEFLNITMLGFLILIKSKIMKTILCSCCNIKAPKLKEIRIEKSDSASILEVKNLNKSYGDTKILDDLSFDIPRGKISAIIGKNGCGKSTTIKTLLRYTDFDDGEIIFHPSDSERNSRSSFIAYAPQNDLHWKSFKVKDVFRIFGLLRGQSMKEIGDKCTEMLESFNLENREDSVVDSLSGGSQRKVTLAVILVEDALLTFLDEPTSSIDPDSRSEIWKVIDKRSKDCKQTLVLCSHTPKEIAVLAEHLMIYDRGRVKVQGYYDDLLLENLKPNKLEMTPSHTKECSLISGSRSDSTIQRHLVYEEPSAIDLFFKVLGVTSQDQGSIETISKSVSLSQSSILNEEFGSQIELVERTSNESLRQRARFAFLKIFALFYRLAIGFCKKHNIFIFLLVPLILNLFSHYMINAEIRGTSSVASKEVCFISSVGNVFQDSIRADFTKYNTFSYTSDEYGKAYPKSLKDSIGGSSVDSPHINENFMIDPTEIWYEKIISMYGNKQLLGGVVRDLTDAYGYKKGYTIIFSGQNLRNSSKAVLNHIANESMNIGASNKQTQKIVVETKVYDEYSRSKVNKVLLYIILSISMSLYFLFFLVSVAIILYRDKESKFKHFLKTQGVPMALYWLSIYTLYSLIFTFNIWILFGSVKLLFDGFASRSNELKKFALTNAYIFSSLAITIIFVLICDDIFSITVGMVFGFGILGYIPAIIFSLLKSNNIRNESHYSWIVFKYFLYPPFKYVGSIIAFDTEEFFKDDISTLKVEDFNWMIGQQFLYSFLMICGVIIYEHGRDILNIFRRAESQLNQSYDIVKVENVSKMYYTHSVRNCSCLCYCLPDCIKSKLISNRRATEALSKINMQVRRNSFHALIGENGAGKTTLFKLLTNEISPTRGQILLDDVPISHSSNMNGKIGYCPQSPAVPHDLTVEQAMYFMQLIRGVGSSSKIKYYIKTSLEAHKLTKLAKKPFYSLSGGERKMAALSLINYDQIQDNRMKVIMLDEAYGALDFLNQHYVARWMRNAVAKDITVIFSTHFYDELRDMTCNMTLLKKGVATNFNDFDESSLCNRFEFSVRFRRNSSPKDRKRFKDKMNKCKSCTEVYTYKNQVYFEVNSNELITESDCAERLRRDLDKVLRDTSSEDNPIRMLSLPKKILSSQIQCATSQATESEVTHL